MFSRRPVSIWFACIFTNTVVWMHAKLEVPSYIFRVYTLVNIYINGDGLVLSLTWCKIRLDWLIIELVSILAAQNPEIVYVNAWTKYLKGLATIFFWSGKPVNHFQKQGKIHMNQKE